jgi:hypothetical protein
VERNARAAATVEEEEATVEAVAEDMVVEAEEAMGAEAGTAAGVDMVAAEREALSGIVVLSLSKRAKRSK